LNDSPPIGEGRGERGEGVFTLKKEVSFPYEPIWLE